MAEPQIINTRAIATGTGSIGIQVADRLIVHNTTARGGSSDLLLDAAARLFADNIDYGTASLGAGAIIEPMAGDRSAWDTLSYFDLHASDIDDASFTYHNDPLNPPLGAALTSGHIFVGNGSNVAADVAMSNDATMANTGALTLKNTGPGATGPLGGATVAPIITIDAKGRVTALSSTTITGVTPAAHQLTGALHTESGLTAGDILTALTATTFGFAAPPAGGIPQIYNETQTADGVSLTYYLVNFAAPSTIRVYIDGIRQPASDDVAPTDTVVFDVAPDAGAVLLFDYEMDTT